MWSFESTIFDITDKRQTFHFVFTFPNELKYYFVNLIYKFFV